MLTFIGLLIAFAITVVGYVLDYQLSRIADALENNDEDNPDNDDVAI